MTASTTKACAACGKPIDTRNASGRCKVCFDAMRRAAVEARNARRKCSECGGYICNENRGGACLACLNASRAAKSVRARRAAMRCPDCGKPLGHMGTGHYCHKHTAARNSPTIKPIGRDEYLARCWRSYQQRKRIRATTP